MGLKSQINQGKGNTDECIPNAAQTHLASNIEGWSAIRICPECWNRRLCVLRRASSWGQCSKMCCSTLWQLQRRQVLF